MMRLLALLFLCSQRCCSPGEHEAHSYDAATLTLTEVADGTFAIDWRTTAKTLEGLRQPAQYPKSCQQHGALLECGPLGLVGTHRFSVAGRR